MARAVCTLLDRAPTGLLILTPSGECIASNATLVSLSRHQLDPAHIERARISSQNRPIIDALRRAAVGEVVVVETDEPPFLDCGQGTWRLHFLPFVLQGESGVAVLFEDLTEHQLTLEAFHASEQRFRLLVDSAGDGIVVHRGRVLLYVNPEAVRLLGYGSPDELVGRPLLDLVQSDHSASFDLQVSQCERSGVPALFETLFLRRDGRSYPAECRISHAQVDEGNAGFVFFRDISERRRLQARRENARRLEALSRLSTNVSIEWQQWLGHLRRVTSRLEQHIGEIDDRGLLLELNELLAAAQERAQEFSVLTETTPRNSDKVDLEMLVSRTLRSLERRLRQRDATESAGTVRLPDVELIVDLEPCELPVRGAARAIEHALETLAFSALLSRGTSSSLRVQGWREPDAERSSKTYYLSMASGPARPESRHRSSFSPFSAPFATWEQGRDLQVLGAFAALQSQGVGAEVYATVEGGVGFELELLLDSKEATSRDEPSDSEPATDSLNDGTTDQPPTLRSDTLSSQLAVPGSESPHRILICDDEQRLMTLTAGLLREYGYEVTTVGSGAEALTALEEQSVDLVLLDVNLPGEDTLEVIQRMQETGDLPIVLSSGYAEEDLGVALRGSPGVEAFLSKPYSVDTLVDTIERILADRRARAWTHAASEDRS